MTLVPLTGVERLVKSTDRVRDLGEVFTPAATVQAMLDLLPASMWHPHPAPTFWEPACGDGNFLVAILDRKLDAITQARGDRMLARGNSTTAVVAHGLEALASIYAVDISRDNVIGGTPGHEIGARGRLLSSFVEWLEAETGGAVVPDDPAVLSAAWIVERNVQVGNTLSLTSEGTPSGQAELPLCEYVWDPEAGTVEVAVTSLGAVIQTAQEDAEGSYTLFGPPQPTRLWAGPAVLLHTAPTSPARTPRQSRKG